MPVVEHKASDFLLSLTDIEEYLAAAIEDRDHDPETFSVALRNVAEILGNLNEFQVTALFDSLLSRSEFQNQTGGLVDRAMSISGAVDRGNIEHTGSLSPVDMAIAADGSIYVVNRYLGHIPVGSPLTLSAPDNIPSKAIGSFGEAEGEFVWPTAVALDKAGNIYVADEWLNRITKFTSEGEIDHWWGITGSGIGELNGPSGLAIDSKGQILVVDSKNNRVQRFTLDGQFVGSFGSAGSGPGQFDLPWGIELDSEDNIYIADWRNARIQIFDANGEWRQAIEPRGYDTGGFDRPKGVAVDADGDIYVSDWSSDLVHVFDSNGRFISHFSCNTNISEQNIHEPNLRFSEVQYYKLASPYFSVGRSESPLPLGVRVDSGGRIAVLDSVGGAIHLYVKREKSDNSPINFSVGTVVQL